MDGTTNATLGDLASEIHDIALEKGWWDPKSPRTFGDLIALCHSELSEALEDFRAGRDLSTIYYAVQAGPTLDEFGYENREPQGVPVELADVIIRVLDLCEFYGIDIERAIKLKMQYNARRPFRHGGKTI